MIRYKCPKCNGDQYSANPNKSNEPCIYCGYEKHDDENVKKSVAKDLHRID